ncbi:MAG: FAD-dependent oxidoreductase, partial [Phycicoccus sp.]
ELLVDAASDVRVTVLGQEPVPAYNRVLLSGLVAGSTSSAALSLAPPAHPRVRVLTGTAAVDVDRGRQVVRDEHGEEHGYDELVLATGSAPRVPPIHGVAWEEGFVDGVFVLRDLADATGIVEAAGRARRAVVLGAGVLGVEVAGGLAQRGLSVRVVHLAGRLMERHLGWEASQVAIAGLERLGITTHTDASVAGVTVRRGRLEAVRFADGHQAAADLFVMCCGTVPETVLAQRAGLTCERGVLVDSELRSPSDPHVHAIGDCAQPPEGSTGLVAQGWQQAARLAAGLAGRSVPLRRLDAPPGQRPAGRQDAVGVNRPTSSATAVGGHDVVRLKAPGMSVVSMGVSGEIDSAGHRVVSLKDPEGGRYVEVVVAGGRLVGATCIGDATVAAALSALYTRGLPVPEDPALLLVRTLAGATSPVVQSSPGDLADEDRVCTCNSVSAGRVRDAVRAGCASVADVARETRASTGCGDCASVVAGLLAATAADPVADPDPVVDPPVAGPDLAGLRPAAGLDAAADVRP